MSGEHTHPEYVKYSELEQLVLEILGEVVDPPPDEPPPDEPPPDEPPPPVGERRGYGAGVTGGEGGLVIEVATADELVAAVALNESRIIQITVPELNLEKKVITIDPGKPNLSILGLDGGSQLYDGSLFVRGDNGRVNLVLERLEIACGDKHDNPDDVDAFGVNARGGNISGIYALNCTFAGAPDVNAAFLGDVSEMTLDRCVIAYGLLHSNHSQSGDPDGHSYGLNLTKLGDRNPRAPHKITVVECADVWNQRRWAATEHAGPIDFIDCVHYGHNLAPHGNPASLNIIGNVYIEAPVDWQATTGRSFEARFWDYRSDSMSKARGVYAEDNKAIDFELEAVSNDPDVLVGAPVTLPSVESGGSDTTLNRVLTLAGARGGACIVTARALDSIDDRSGGYENGLDAAEPRFEW